MRLIPEKDFKELQRHPVSQVWYVRKYVNGKERLKSTGEKVSKTRAKQIAMRILSEWYGKPVKGYVPTFDDVAQKVIQLKAAKAPATKYSAEVSINLHLLPFFSGTRVDEITETMFEEYVVQKQLERPGIKLFNHWKHFIQIMTLAHRSGLIPRPLRVKNPDGETLAGKVYTPEEVTRLIAAANKPLKLAITLAYTMGMRRGEILGLEWDRVDLDRRIISLRKEDTKIRRAREFGISDEALELLQACENRSGYVFPSRYDSSARSRGIKTAWGNCRRRAGVSGRFHDLRHTFLTNVLLVKKANPLDVAVFAGVSLEEIQKTYLHPTVEHTRVIAGLVRVNSGN
jgi:integrase